MIGIPAQYRALLLSIQDATAHSCILTAYLTHKKESIPPNQDSFCKAARWWVVCALPAEADRNRTKPGPHCWGGYDHWFPLFTAVDRTLGDQPLMDHSLQDDKFRDEGGQTEALAS